MTKLFEKADDLSGYLFRITDNGGETADRYTVVFSDGSYITMNRESVSQTGKGLDPKVMANLVKSGKCVDLTLDDLTPDQIQHILDRKNEDFRDLLEALERGDGVVKSRAESPVHKNIGDGIYLTVCDKGETIYRVRSSEYDGLEYDDWGPYSTVSKALCATLPYDFKYCSDEYHPEVNVMGREIKDVTFTAIELEKSRLAKKQADLAAWEAKLAATLEENGMPYLASVMRAPRKSDTAAGLESKADDSIAVPDMDAVGQSAVEIPDMDAVGGSEAAPVSAPSP